jgi:hypothetical protein
LKKYSDKITIGTQLYYKPEEIILKKIVLLIIFATSVILIAYFAVFKSDKKELPQNTSIQTNKATTLTYTPTRKKAADLMSIEKTNDKEIQILSDFSKSLTLKMTFDKKDWGTWNIGGWYVAENTLLLQKKFIGLAGGGTDWEYVFRAGKNDKATLEFSGGNHGREILKDIKVLIGNDEFSLDKLHIGEKKKSDSIKIKEETIICCDDARTEQYANVTRFYTLSPSKINLETTFEFVSDIYLGTSYVCMFPVMKNIGKFIKFDDVNKEFSTPDLGKTLTKEPFENYLGKEETLSTTIWGEKSSPYKFKVKIDNAEMVDNFKNKLKVFYWDLNEQQNKLYFSKYDTETPKKIFKGDKWNNKAEWEIIK